MNRYTAKPGAPLSERETQVVKLIAQDMADKQIADALGCSPKTLDEHTARIRRKLGVRSKVGVAVWAVKGGLV